MAKAPATTTKKAKSPKKAAGGAKKTNPYNQFMKEELARIKAANPTIDHKVAFTQAASNWSKNKEKNAKKE